MIELALITVAYLIRLMGSDNDGGFNGVANVKAQLGIETDNSESILKGRCTNLIAVILC